MTTAKRQQITPDQVSPQARDKTGARLQLAATDHAPKERPYLLPMPIEDAPMYRVNIKTSASVKGAVAWNKSTKLTHASHRVEAVVNDIHDILVLCYR